MKRGLAEPDKKIIGALQASGTFVCFLFIIGCLPLSVMAEMGDTLEINPGNINAAMLREGSNTYLVYLKRSQDGPRSYVQFWDRKIEKISYKSRPAIRITQKWESRDTVIHTSRSICDGASLKPFVHEFWWKASNPNFYAGTTLVDFEQGFVKVGDQELTAKDTSKMLKQVWKGYQSSLGKFFLNWHLDLEIFSTLPYKQGVTFLIPFYDPGTKSGFDKVSYTVQGTGYLNGFDGGKIECWMMVHTADGLRETFWVSKKNRELLKVEQVMNNSLFFYEIKLGIAES